MSIGVKNLQGCKTALVTGLMAIGLLAVDQQSASAAQSFSCNGSMNNGWVYTAEFVDGRFTRIRWERSGQPPQTTNLTFSNTNAQGQPIYTGAFQAATAVTLVDLSGGNVQPGSEISVSVEEWGTSTASCGLSAGGSTPPVPPPVTQPLFCDGRMTNGWAYTAEHTDGRFTQIRWERSGQPPQTTTLTRSGTNVQGQPIYRGAFQAATAVTLVDLSGGNVQPGSAVSVGVEEWGWARGRCRS
ncbi:MAG: hypothetical protein IGS50_04030 [Synechococcales cyanobacterium C42_A2020_086]|jgi:hypothetical protein|nr:hypothetical protein [Synechococcales cyanobacterium M58_A2018_015]MBF2072917.1 hypothetical protein [Synechococcales cyanobacterium C42_A2020_086]